MQDRWRALWLLCAARVVMGYQFQAVGACAPLLRERWDLGLAEIGWMAGLFLLPGLVFAVPGGMLSARFGDRRIAVTGTVLMVAGGVLAAVADSAGTLEAARLVGGTGGVLFNLAASKMVTDWFAGRELALAMSCFISTWPLGILLALLTLTPLAVGWAPSAAFAATAVVALVSVLLLVFAYRDAPGAAGAGAPTLGWHALRPGDGWRLALAASGWSLYNVAFVAVASFLPALLAARGLAPAEASALTSVVSLTTLASIPLAGWLGERTGRPVHIAAIGLLGWAVCMLAVWAGAAPLPWLAASGLLSGVAAGQLVSAPGRFLSPAARPVGLGLFYTGYYVGIAILPRLIGALADAAGTAEVVLLAVAALAAITLGLMLATERVVVGAMRRDAAPGTR